MLRELGYFSLADPGGSHGVLTPLKSVAAPKLGIGYTPCS